MNENEIMVNEEVTDETEVLEEQTHQMGMGSGIALGIILTVAAIAVVKKVPGVVAKLKSRKKDRAQAQVDGQDCEACNVEVMDKEM